MAPAQIPFSLFSPLDAFHNRVNRINFDYSGSFCIFTLSRTTSTPGGPRPEKLIVGVYVDDLAVVYTHTDSHSLYSQFVKDLKKWDVEDEGDLSDLLGIEFSFGKETVTLTQTAYINRMVKAYLPDGIPSTFQVYNCIGMVTGAHMRLRE